MTTTRKSYKGLVIVLTFILIALFIYVNRDQKDDNTELLKEKEFQNRKLLDSLNKVGGELVRVIEEQKRREAESFDKFKRETERLKKEYDEKRQQYLESYGLKVFRITNHDILQNSAVVMKDLERYIIQNFGVEEGGVRE